MTEVLLKIGELAARAGVSIRTVDYYTCLGLISPAQRTAGNYRLYEPGDVERIHLVQRLELQGVPLDEIATAFNTRQADVTPILDRIDEDLRALHAATESASPEAHGVLAAIATRVHSLVTLALDIPPLP
ncbi:MerR family transcriptional regulator [Saccharothrix sp. ALI-22-I]|uniref:helix-turn-helix domain-containing protein n=1 Tax=Saccharothrix sp. ALI-22-I TaxID=1933778 RepID=UPI00097C3F98|nr:MerR family transcriptional regulator [Saccharothrix sp. ALI-22-I]ONI80670.1 MerR family transcriptional regulator [Saccharothrix sp. ALI-22-I]